jgi:hypothetical protein
LEHKRLALPIKCRYYEFQRKEITGKEILVELQSLSHAYYLFLKTRQASSDMDEIISYFTEPVQIYSNITGGIGILGNYSSSIYTIPLK